MFDYFNLFWLKKTENPLQIKSSHAMLYFYILKVANDNYWPDIIGMPTDFTMQKCGFGSYRLYKQTFDDLVQFGLIYIVKKSRNGNEATQVGLNKMFKASDKASAKASDKAHQNQSTKHLHHNNTIKTTKDKEDNKDYLGEISSPINKLSRKGLKISHELTPEQKQAHTPEMIARFENLNKWIDNNTPNVRFIDQQITIDNFAKMVSVGDISEILKEKLTALHNNKKYFMGKEPKVSVYLTVMDWIRRDYKQKR